MFFFRCFFFSSGFNLLQRLSWHTLGRLIWIKSDSNDGVLLVDLMGIKLVNRVDESSPTYDSVWIKTSRRKVTRLWMHLFFCKDFQATGFFLGVLWFSFLCPEFFFSELTYSPENCWSWTSTPVEEENHLPNLHLQVPAIRFSAVSPRKTLQSKAYPRWWTAKTLRQK